MAQSLSAGDEAASYLPGSPERNELARRTIRVLQLGVIPGGLAMTASFSAATLLADQMTGSETKASLAAVCLSIGGTLAGIPLAALMARHGRRAGLAAGYSVGAIGGTLALLSAFAGRYSMLVAGMVLIGTGQAANLAARYAGADLATDENRARSISLVLWAGTVGSVLGPTAALGLKSLFADTEGLSGFALPYALTLGLFAVAAVNIWRRLRPDPLRVVAADTGSAGVKLPSLAEAGRILAHPVASIALIGMMLSQAVMVGVMTVSPIHMSQGGQNPLVIGIMLSLHIAGMFAFSPYVGWVVDRVGGQSVIVVGALVLATGAAFAANTDASHATGLLWGLFLVGIGWSCCVVAASSLLTASFTVERRVSVQATADVLMTALGAAAGVSSGLAVEHRSYADLASWGAWVAVALGIAAVAMLVRNFRMTRRLTV
ncbi:MFS transporter [Candidatus Poriferisodalis sp.]|uniref:MFS transporter n=1 Tax=Candidatus Poriferisodalis sp. TaxID=3101277 RepID=UPI003B01CC7F